MPRAETLVMEWEIFVSQFWKQKENEKSSKSNKADEKTGNRNRCQYSLYFIPWHQPSRFLLHEIAIFG